MTPKSMRRFSIMGGYSGNGVMAAVIIDQIAKIQGGQHIPIHDEECIRQPIQ